MQVASRRQLPAKVVLVTAALVCAFAVSFNLLIDPYGAWRAVTLPGLNVRKPALYHRMKLAKAYEIRQLAPEAIVLGTSRSHIALRPGHEGWAVPIGDRYNAAFDGATTKEMEAYLRHAQAVHKLRQVVLGLDTWHLSRAPASVRQDFDPSVLYANRTLWQRISVLLADLRILVSIDTLHASFATLLGQEQEARDWLAADGQRLGPVFFREVEQTFQAQGTGDYLRGVDREEAGFKLPDPPGRNVRPPPEPPATAALTSFDHIARIVAFCREQDIDLRLLLTPAHAHQLELAADVGEWPAIERGKRDLVDLLARDAAQHPGSRAFPLVDFSGYSVVTTETVPPSGSKAEMAFYWDSSHFKEHVGDWILDRLFGFARLADPAPPDFGVVLYQDSTGLTGCPIS